MTVLQSILLGITQGITEFLPISSSGHLVIIQDWLQINSPPFIFDVYLHIISVVVIAYFFREQLSSLSRQMILTLALATSPLVVVGFLIRNQAELLFESSLLAGFGLLVTACFNFIAAKKYQTKAESKGIDFKKAWFIGISQVIALLPGVSRSSATLFGASMQQVSKQVAFEFSFLMAIFAILAASLGQLLVSSQQTITAISNTHWSSYLAGGIVCFVVSLASLRLLRFTLNKAHYHWFGWYCLVLGVVTVLSSFIG